MIYIYKQKIKVLSTILLVYNLFSAISILSEHIYTVILADVVGFLVDTTDVGMCEVETLEILMCVVIVVNMIEVVLEFLS